MSEAVVAGNQFDIGIALQSAKGVTVADAGVQYRFPVTAGGMNAEKDVKPIEETSSGRLRNTSYVGAINVGGSPSLAARPGILGLLLYGIFGSKAVTGAGDPYEHTFELAATQPWFTVWKRIGPMTGGYYEKYRDCKITALKLQSSAEGLMIATPTIIGLRAANVAAAVNAVDVDISPVVFAHHHGEGAMLVDGVAVASISDLTIDIGGDSARIKGTSLYGVNVAEQMRSITIDTKQLVDWALLRQVLYGTATPADGDLPNDGVLELAAGIDFTWDIPGADTRTLQILAPRVQTKIDAVDPNTGGAALEMSVHHMVYQPEDPGDSALTAILNNGVASYPALP